MACLIAESARVHPRARVHEDAVIGPCCVIGPRVQIGRGTRLLSQVCVMGVTRIGEFNTLGPFVSIGDVPQDVSCDDPDTEVQIGDHNTIHERVTIHRGSEKEDGITRIGSNNQLFAGAVSPTTARSLTGSRLVSGRCSAATFTSSLTWQSWRRWASINS